MPSRKSKTSKNKAKTKKKTTPRTVSQSQKVHVIVKNSIGDQAPDFIPFQKQYSTYAPAPVLEAMPSPRPYEPALLQPIGRAMSIGETPPLMRNDQVANTRGEGLMDRFFAASPEAQSGPGTSSMTEPLSVERVQSMTVPELKQVLMNRGHERISRLRRDELLELFYKAPP